MAPDLEVEGEMHADAALSKRIRARIFPNSRLQGRANLLVMPTLDAANAAFNLVKVLAEGLKRAGKNLTREGFVRAMESIQDYDAGGFKVSFGPGKRSGSQFVDLTIISKDQKFVR